MLEKQILPPESIIECIQTQYGIEIACFVYLPLGADMNASVYKAQTKNNQAYFIKIKRSYNAQISICVTQLLSEAGIRQVILPLKTLSGQLTHNLGDCILIVYPYIQGEDGFRRQLSKEQWILLGKTLRQIHEVKVPPSIKKLIPQEAYSNRYCEIVRSLMNSLDEGPKYNEFTLMTVRFLRENKPIIHNLIDRAVELRALVKDQPASFVLCHADIHGGNVLIDENDAIYIVDWDEPIMAPKERDLMFIGGGVANVWNQSHEEEYFYTGYGHVEVNKTILSYYRYNRIVVDIAESVRSFFPLQ